MKLFKIIRKNLEVLIRSKSSALVVILGPLLLILLVGLAFSNSSSLTLKVGVYSPEYNELTNSFVETLKNSSYSLSKFNTEQECVDAIKQSKIHSCVVFPAGFEIAKAGSNQVKFYVDQTKLNFVYAVRQSINSAIEKERSQASMNLTGNVLDLIAVTRQDIESQKKGVVTTATQNMDTIVSKSKGLQSTLTGNKVDTSGVSGVSITLQDASNDLSDAISLQKDDALAATLLYWELSDLGYAILRADPTINQTILTDNLNSFEEYKGDDDGQFDQKDLLWKDWNASDTARRTLVNASEQLNQKTNQLVTAIQDSEQKQAQVAAELQTSIDAKAAETKASLQGLSSSMDVMLQRIDALEVADAQNIVSPITTTVETVVPNKTNLNYLFPSLIMLLIMFISIMLASTMVVMEKNSRAYLRNFTTPTSDFTFVISTYLTSLFVMFLQFFIVLGITGWYFKSTSILTNLSNILLVTLFLASIFILLGMIIGYAFSSQETALMGSISIASIFLLISDTVFPLESMPVYIQEIAKNNPFVLGVAAFREALIYEATFSQMLVGLAKLGFYILVLFFFVLLIQQISKNLFLNRFTHGKTKAVDLVDVRTVFKVGLNPVTNYTEFIESIKSMTDKEFGKVVNRRIHYVADWVDLVLNDLDLTKEVRKLRKKEEVLAVLLKKQGELSIKEDKKHKKHEEDSSKGKEGKENKKDEKKKEDNKEENNKETKVVTKEADSESDDELDE